jgi:zinc/manganese transport system substrate-binding protein
VNTTKLMATSVVALSIVGVLAGCSTSAVGSGSGTAAGGKIVAVGAENEYASVISQIGGDYVSVSSIMSNPNTDPHTFEASASVAKEIGAAKLIVQNGVGYDDFMTKIESSSSAPADDVIVAQKVLGLPDDTPNPHLWYKPSTMPAVAKAIAARLEKLDPSHAEAFKKNLATFQASLTPWTNELSTFKSTYPDVPVAVTEPVADYALEAAGADIKTPFSLQASIMNDTDPSPQDSATQDALFTGGKVKAFLYNQQVTDAVTSKYLALAEANHIPVVGVYETMPTDGYTYQTWMLAEVKALEKALATGTSTEKL